MTLLLTIGAGVVMTAIAVAIGGFLLEMILSALNRSLRQSVERPAPLPTSMQVIDLHPNDNNLGAMDWGEKVAA